MTGTVFTEIGREIEALEGFIKGIEDGEIMLVTPQTEYKEDENGDLF